MSEAIGETRAGDRRLRLPRQRDLVLGGVPRVMGILNVTPDSFSDGGMHLAPEAAIGAALAMEQDGAALLDIGGESTRPGADEVAVEEELRRILPVIQGIRSRSAIPISVDTRKAAVAVAALDAGADLVNDVSALRHDPALSEVIRERGVPVILMHMRGDPRTMQREIHYQDLMGEVGAELRQWRQDAIDRGIDASMILVDPGIGFGKSFDHNVEILARFGELAGMGPVVIGASRKGFIGHLTGRKDPEGRVAGSLGAVAAAAVGGAAIIRVHDVRETVEFLRVFTAVMKVKG